MPVIVSIKMEVKTSGHDLLCDRSLRLERQSVSYNRQGRSCWSRGELLVSGIRFSEFPCMCGPGHREEEPGVTGGQGDVTNRKPAKPGGRGGTSPSRRRSLHPVEALGGAEDLEGGKESQIHRRKRRERISPVYRSPPGERKHVAIATHSKAWRQELLPVISMLGETQLTQKTRAISPNKTGSDDLNETPTSGRTVWF